MRIGIITPGYSRNDQDWAIPVLRHLVRELTKRHEITIFTLRHPNVRETYFVDGVEVIAIGGGVVGGIGRIPLYLRALRTIQQAEPFDILHGFWADEPSFLAVLAGKRLGIPVVASVFGGELVHLPDIAYGGARSRINRLLSRYALRHANIVTAGSRFVADIARGVAPVANVVQWSQGVRVNDIAETCERGEKSGLHLLHVGALTPVKDQTALLQAFKAISAELPTAHLSIAGEGYLRHELERLAITLGVSEQITFLEHVAHEAMGRVYQSADLLLLTSRHESQAMVLLEAIAHGCPVIGTRVGLIPELAPPELTANPEDAAALARATISLLSDAAARHALFQTQYDALKNRFTLDDACSQICDVYTAISTTTRLPESYG